MAVRGLRHHLQLTTCLPARCKERKLHLAGSPTLPLLSEHANVKCIFILYQASFHDNNRHILTP